MVARNYRNVAGRYSHTSGVRNGLVVAGISVAGWMRYVSGVDDAGNAIDFAIRLAIKFANLLRAAAVNKRNRPAFPA